MSEDTPGSDVDVDQPRVSFIRHDTMDKNTSPPVALQVIGGSRPSQTSEPSISSSSGANNKESIDEFDEENARKRSTEINAAAAPIVFSSTYRDRQKFLMDDGDGDAVRHSWNRMQDSMADEDDDDEESLQGNVGFHEILTNLAGGDKVGNFLMEDDDALAPFPRVSSSQILYETKRKPPKIVGNYLIGDQLGEGSYGKVKEALDCNTLCRRAVKILKERRLRKIFNGEQDVQREIRLLQRLRHRNVIRLFDVLKNNEKQKMYLFIEYCVGSLQEMLDSAPGKKFPIWQAHLYFNQLLDGLEYLHGQSIVHKDIKPGNLLLTTDETLKITDLGVAEELERYMQSDLCHFGRGTPKFQPPEIAGGQTQFFGFPVDVWSSGVTLYNFVSGLYPYEGENVYKLYDNISKKEVPTPPDIDQLLEELLKGMLCKNVQQRFLLQTVRNHVWVTKKHPQTLDRVPPPAYKGDPVRYMTVYGYLEQMYGPQSSSSSVILDSPPAGAQQLTVMSERDYFSKAASKGCEKNTFGGSEPDTINKFHHNSARDTATGTTAATSGAATAAIDRRVTSLQQQQPASLVRKSSSEPRTNKLHFGGKGKPKVNFCKIQ